MNPVCMAVEFCRGNANGIHTLPLLRRICSNSPRWKDLDPDYHEAWYIL